MTSGTLGIGIALMAFVAQFGATQADESEYVIEAPDVLEIQSAGIGLNSITGKYQVQPDGKVSLKKCGSVSVAGLTVGQARAAVLTLLSPHANRQGAVAVLLGVAARKSKVYYVVTPDQNGKKVFSFGLAGDETAVSAVLKVEGLASLAMDQGVSIIRPSNEAPEVLEVDWKAITHHGRLASNHKLRAGDRIVVGGSR